MSPEWHPKAARRNPVFCVRNSRHHGAFLFSMPTRSPSLRPSSRSASGRDFRGLVYCLSNNSTSPRAWRPPAGGAQKVRGRHACPISRTCTRTGTHGYAAIPCKAKRKAAKLPRRAFQNALPSVDAGAGTNLASADDTGQLCPCLRRDARPLPTPTRTISPILCRWNVFQNHI